MRAATILVAVLGAACVEPGAVICSDGRTCPEGTTCDTMRSLCLTDEQVTVCNEQGISNGDVCIANGNKGICELSTCLPGCGDGTTDPDEQCDDGNFASHDGCSSRCEVEVPTWIPYVPAWNGISAHMTAYHPGIGTGRTVLFGGIAPDGPSNRIWQRDPAKTTEPELGWREITAAYSSDRPPTRTNGAMVYDPVRNVLVLFGGATGGNPTIDDYVTETWEYGFFGRDYNGEPIGNWIKSTSTTSPTPRLFPAMAFDENLGKIVMLGGLDPTLATLPPFSPEMWTYDGQWTQITPNGSFPARSRAALAFDSTRDRLVYYGGGSNNTDVYEYDGSTNTWAQFQATTGPGPRRNPSFAFSVDRGTCVMFGGTLPDGSSVASDTWEWNGATWQLVSSVKNPSGRRSGGLAQEPGGLLVIGGQRLEGEPFPDAWLFSASDDEWVDQTPRFGPGVEADSQGSYSPTSGGVLVMGGIDTLNNALTETWLFDGKEWKHLPDIPDIATSTTEGRFGNNTIYDPVRDRFLTFGGASTFDDDMDELADHHKTLWQLPGNGTGTWSQVPTPANAPRGRLDAAGVYDPNNARVVVFGGVHDDLTPAPGTLFYDGTTWTSVSPGEHPAGGYRPAAGFDPVRGVVIAFDVAGDTWQLEGTAWTKVIPAATPTPGLPATTPPPRELAIFAYDPYRKRFVLAGGLRPGIGAGLDDAWELDPATWTWTPLFVAGAGPLPISDTLVATYHDNLRGIVIHGGRGGANLTQGRTWIMKFVSNTKDELCTDGVDTDLDAQPDSEDPDCDPPPP